MGVFIDPFDLEPFAEIDPAKAEAMIDDAEAQAMLAAPCLEDDALNSTLSDLKRKAVRSILRSAILRWDEQGSGALAGESVGTGPFSNSQTIDTRQPRKRIFWPSEITDLQSICATGNEGKAFSIDTVPSGSIHSPFCNLAFGAAYCSCGADIAGFPLYEPVD